MKKFYLLLFSLFFLAGVEVYSQTIVNIVADRDNTIYSESNAKSNGSGEHSFAGVTARGNIRRLLLHFDLSSIPATAAVTSVTLTLHANRLASGSQGVVIHKLTGNWGEGSSDASGQEGSGANSATNDASWVNSFFSTSNWTNPGGDFSPLVSGNITTVVLGSNPITQGAGSQLLADVQSFVNQPGSNHGWIILGNDEGGSQNAIRFVSRENAATASRPVLSVTYTNTLPIKLGYFNAKLSKSDAMLVWETTSETNNAFFDVEHSNNGVTFTSFGRVNGSGSTVLRQQYSFIHPNIPAGKNFYRLAQQDINGARSYSRVVVLSTYGKGEIVVYPNPSASLLNITAPFLADLQNFSIENYAGQPMKAGRVSGSRLNIQSLPAGIYLLSIEAPDGTWFRSKFIKQ
jgi:hypothetical protein